MSEPIIYVNGELVEKSKAVISVYDSGLQHGDGVYEGIRVYNNRIFMLDEHIQRLFESAKTIDINIGITREEMKSIVKRTIRANKHIEDSHIRLIVTRGKKEITGMNPKLNKSNASIIVCVDSKKYGDKKDGIRLITSSLRRYAPNFLDAKIHSTNQLNQIMAVIEANRQDAEDAIMLDINGFVAETNSSTIFMIKDGVLLTPTTKYLVVGITRRLLIDLARKYSYKVVERDISLSEFYNADEVFTCGTQGELISVREIDGKAIGSEVPGKITSWLSEKYHELTESIGELVD